jgi:hypothetical protein
MEKTIIGWEKKLNLPGFDKRFALKMYTSESGLGATFTPRE